MTIILWLKSYDKWMMHYNDNFPMINAQIVSTDCKS